MIRHWRMFAVLVLWATAQMAWSAELQIESPWARALPPVVKVGAAYLTIANKGAHDDILISVRSDIAERVELHEHTTEGGMMRMRQMQEVHIPAGADITFAPGGKHLMLIGLRKPLAASTHFTLTLVFASAGEVSVVTPIIKQ